MGRATAKQLLSQVSRRLRSTGSRLFETAKDDALQVLANLHIHAMTRWYRGFANMHLHQLHQTLCFKDAFAS